MTPSQIDFISLIERLARQEVLSEGARKDVADIRADIHTGFGKLDARFAGIEIRLQATEDAVKAAKLGWRLLVTIGSLSLALASTCGALLAKWVPLTAGFPK